MKLKMHFWKWCSVHVSSYCRLFSWMWICLFLNPQEWADLFLELKVRSCNIFCCQNWTRCCHGVNLTNFWWTPNNQRVINRTVNSIHSVKCLGRVEYSAWFAPGFPGMCLHQKLLSSHLLFLNCFNAVYANIYYSVPRAVPIIISSWL